MGLTAKRTGPQDKSRSPEWAVAAKLPGEGRLGEWMMWTARQSQSQAKLAVRGGLAHPGAEAEPAVEGGGAVGPFRGGT